MHRSSRYRPIGISALAVFLALFATACSSSSDGSGTTGSIAITLGSTSASIAEGGTAQLSATLTRAGGFTGDVAFTVSGTPSGVTATISNIQTSGTTTSAVVNIVVGSGATVGTSSLIVTAKAAGILDATASFVLTITAPPPTPGFALQIAPGPLSILQGGSSHETVTITRTGSFAGSVNLSLTGAPAGVAATFAPNDITGNGSTATISVGSAVAPGQYNVAIKGVASGLPDNVAPLVLTVTVAGSYSLSVPSAVAIAQGTTASTTVTLTRVDGFNPAVALSITGLPAGLTAAFVPASAPGTTATLTFTATAGLAAGAYPVVVHANAAGTTEQTGNVTVTVNAASGVRVDFSACLPSLRPVWFAIQDGDGPWTRISGTNDVYAFSVSSARAGVAYVVQAGSVDSVIVGYALKTELAAATTLVCNGYPNSTKVVNGTVAGVTQFDRMQVSLGGATAFPGPSFFFPDFALSGVATGPQDVIAWRHDLTQGLVSDRGLIRRDVNVADGGTFGTIDMNGAESYAIQRGTLTVLNAGALIPMHSTDLATNSHCYFANLYNGFGTTGFMPASLQRAGDLYRLTAFVRSSGGVDYRDVVQMFHTFPPAITVTLGSSLGTPAITALPASYRRLQAVFAVPPEYQGTAMFRYADNAGTRVVQVIASMTWVGSSTATLSLPDFSSIAGWNDAWAPATTASINWSATAASSTVAAGGCQDGATQMHATASGGISAGLRR